MVTDWRDDLRAKGVQPWNLEWHQKELQEQQLVKEESSTPQPWEALLTKTPLTKEDLLALLDAYGTECVALGEDAAKEFYSHSAHLPNSTVIKAILQSHLAPDVANT